MKPKIQTVIYLRLNTIAYVFVTDILKQNKNNTMWGRMLPAAKWGLSVNENIYAALNYNHVQNILRKIENVSKKSINPSPPVTMLFTDIKWYFIGLQDLVAASYLFV